jgi:hypothetical protein
MTGTIVKVSWSNKSPNAEMREGTRKANSKEGFRKLFGTRPVGHWFE